VSSPPSKKKVHWGLGLGVAAGRQGGKERAIISRFRLKLPLLCCAVLATGFRGSVETEEEFC
jgi:hypothetical protein